MHTHICCALMSGECGPTSGVFAARDIKAQEIVCLAPGCLVTEANVADQETSYMWALTMLKKADDWGRGCINTWYDASAFQGSVLGPDRLAHLINSCDKTLPYPYNIANILYIVGEISHDDYTVESLLYCVASCDFSKGTEMLGDYHWHLAVDRSYLGNKRYPCDCSKCAGSLVYCTTLYLIASHSFHVYRG